MRETTINRQTLGDIEIPWDLIKGILYEHVEKYFGDLPVVKEEISVSIFGSYHGDEFKPTKIKLQWNESETLTG